MREQLIHYVDLLFAGAPQAGEIKQEILQNTLDRYDDLISQGKAPQAAYQLAICGIGDINELLGSQPQGEPPMPAPVQNVNQPGKEEKPDRKLVTALAVALYILCPVPLFLLGDVGNGTVGLCLLLFMVAAATAILVMYGKDNDHDAAGPEKPSQAAKEPQSELLKCLRILVNVCAWIVFLALSFQTRAWLVTWLIFPISAAINGLLKAIFDLKEAFIHEK